MLYVVQQCQNFNLKETLRLKFLKLCGKKPSILGDDLFAVVSLTCARWRCWFTEVT